MNPEMEEVRTDTPIGACVSTNKVRIKCIRTEIIFGNYLADLLYPHQRRSFSLAPSRGRPCPHAAAFELDGLHGKRDKVGLPMMAER
jgi:hypothetical protein